MARVLLSTMHHKGIGNFHLLVSLGMSTGPVTDVMQKLIGQAIANGVAINDAGVVAIVIVVLVSGTKRLWIMLWFLSLE